MDVTYRDKLRHLAESLAWQLAGRPDADAITAFGAPASDPNSDEIVYRAFVRCGGDDAYWAHEERVPRATFSRMRLLSIPEREAQIQIELLEKLVDKLLTEAARRKS